VAFVSAQRVEALDFIRRRSYVVAIPRINSGLIGGGRKGTGSRFLVCRRESRSGALLFAPCKRMLLS